MRTGKIFFYYRWLGFCLLICISITMHAQEGLRIASLFEKYKNEKKVTYVELNGGILRSYRMTAYKSLVFVQVSSYKQEILECIKHDVDSCRAEKTQEITEGGELRSAYYRLTQVVRKDRTLNRYILYKTGKQDMATLVYIEGPLDENELMQILYND